MLARLVLLLSCCSVGALQLAAVGGRSLAASTARTPASVAMQFGGKKKKMSAEEELEAKGYWSGEWVCADCGYIYEPGTTPAFEELRPRWKCPQCAGPRRRFVKKAGGVVARVDDSPLVLGTAAVALVTIGLVYVGLTL